MEKPVHILDLSQSLIAIGWRDQFREVLQILKDARYPNSQIRLFDQKLNFYTKLSDEIRTQILEVIPGSFWREI